MPSSSLNYWQEFRSTTLDEIENAHLIIGGTQRGRRFATQQINYAYATLLSSHYQGFCRDLHSECIEHIVAIVPNRIQVTVRAEFIRNRTLDRGNPHPGAIGADFNRLGVDFWTEVYSSHTLNQRRRELLQELVDWRNAIAHQDFSAIAQGGNQSLHLATVRAWRRAISELARQFDQVMYNYLYTLLGNVPW